MTSAGVAADLAADTAVRADAATPGRYAVALPGHWDYMLPSGGVTMTCALRAAAAELADPALALVSATTIFAAPIHPGALTADVHVIRKGGATAQVRVVLRHVQARNVEPGLELVATFARDRRGPDVRARDFPAWARPLADARAVDDGAPNNPHERFRFYHQLECRIADGPAFWQDGFADGPARYARWFRYKVPQRDREGRFDRLALPPIIDTMPTALHRAVGPGEYRFYAPSLDLTVYPIEDTTREWLLVAVELPRAHGGTGVGTAEVWDEDHRLVAWGSQVMYLQGLRGEPPAVDARGRSG